MNKSSYIYNLHMTIQLVFDNTTYPELHCPLRLPSRARAGCPFHPTLFWVATRFFDSILTSLGFSSAAVGFAENMFHYKRILHDICSTFIHIISPGISVFVVDQSERPKILLKY